MKFKFNLFAVLLFVSINSYSEDVIVKWAKSFGGSNNEYGHSIAIDANANLYVTGIFKSPSISFGNTTLINNNTVYPCLFVAKFDSTGNAIWAKQGNDFTYGHRIATDKEGNVIVCGVFSGSSITLGNYTFQNSPESYGQLFLVKYNPSGNVIWAKAAKNTVLSNAPRYVHVDNENNIYITGLFQDNSITFGSLTLNNSNSPEVETFLVKYDKSGNELWAKKFGGNRYDVGTSIATDSNGNVFLTGNFSSSTMKIGSDVLTSSGNTTNIFLCKFTKNGDPIWARSAEGETTNYGSHVAVDKGGNPYICSSFKSSSLNFGSKQILNPNSGYLKSFLVKYDSNGNYLWGKTPELSTKDEEFKHIFIDEYDNLYVNGCFSSPKIKLDTIELKNTLGGNDVFTIKLNSSGKTIWAKTFGGTSNENNFSSVVDNKGAVYFTGEFYSPTIQFDLHKVINKSVGSSDIQLVKLVPLFDTLSIKYCSEDTTITITAPNGYVSYKWTYNSVTKITTDSILTIKNPGVGSIITCEITAADGSKFTTIPKAVIHYILKSDFNYTITNCKTNTVEFTDNSESSHNPVTYKWTFGDGTTSTDKNPTHTFTIGGKNRVILEISNPLSSCTDTISKIVETYSPMNVNVIGNTVLCKGDTSILKATGATTYLWSNGSTSDSIVVNEYTGKIWLLGYYGNGVCVSDTVFRTITVGNPTINITGQLTYCKGNSTLIKAEGAKNYFWSNGLSAADVNFTTSGDYWVVGQSENGCFSDTLKFTISEEPDWNLTLTGNNSFCKGDSTLITASGGLGYSWNNGKTTASVYVKSPGMYIVTAFNQRGCVKTDSITITEHNLPFSDFEMSNTKIDILNNKIYFTITPESNVQYQWDLGDGANETQNSFEHTFNATNSFKDYLITLTASNNFGCSSTTTKTIQVIPFVPNVFTPNKDGVNELFMPGVDLFIYDRYGKTLYKGNSGWDGTYNGKDMPSDTYFYYLTYTDKNQINQSLKGYLTLIR